MSRKREHYIIDGYNVINSWPELIRLRKDLSEARDQLIHQLAEYGAYEKYDITIVFDAMFTDDEEHCDQVNAHMKIIYTGEGETADSRIERLAYDSVRQGREVHVVTSDGAEQSVILGAGAYRIPSLEFRKAVRRAKKQLKREYLGHVTLPVTRLEVEDRLDSETVKKLDILRKMRH
ncbi:NYN domain-containing protein [Selenomonas sp. ND2010]|jgi:predicted RNA-binding protein with PIN domain|uniref:NYN domain-containing protein n=1 Tax=Selenomonas sp. ND2010 TaxID=1410618 RepID=UPI00051ADA22|nr:NYN domain-containing protein [Selenomonas sp. ND2010]